MDSYVNEITGRDENNHLVEAWVGLNNLDALSSLGDVRKIRTIFPPITDTGSVNSEGDSIHRADQLRSLYGANGSGIKVGIISDGVNHRSNAQSTGDLPGDLHVLSDTVGGDEGTALLEIVHDLAPGAELYFHDCGSSPLEFNSALDDLAAAGCKIICDDISWIGEPFFEDGVIAQHVAAVLASNNIIYVSSAGNHAKQHFQGAFYNNGAGHHDFSRGASNYKYLYAGVPPGDNVIAVLQWNDRFGASGNDYNLYLRNANTGTFLASSTDIQSGDDDPIEGVIWTNNTVSTIDVCIDVVKAAGVSKVLEVYIFPSDEAFVYANNITESDSIFGHKAVPGIISVGALDVPDTNQIAWYSSRGPVTIDYPSGETRNKPDLCGMSGVHVTGSGGFSNPFYGTSAAAPHVAAIAALAWSQSPGKTSSEIRSEVVNGAIDLGDSGYDYIYGYGRADALNAMPPDTDLIVQSINGPNPREVGGTISITDTVKNQGNTAVGATFQVDYYLSTDTTITSDDTYLGKRKITGGLAAGAASTATSTFTIPAKQASGSYYVGAIADSTNVVAESDETNNTGCDTTAVSVAAPDLIVQSVNGPASGTPGSVIAITDTVQNQSSADSKAFYVRFYLSADSVISTGDRYIGQRYLSAGLAAGASSTATTNFTIPSSLAGGSYYIGAIADAANAVSESNETNNTGCDLTSIILTKE